MKVVSRENQGVRVLELHGKLLFGHGVKELENAFQKALSEGCRRIVMDLGHVPFIDSAGTGAIAICKKRAMDASARVSLVIPVASSIHLHVQSCLRLMFETVDEETQAIAALSR
jgi:anti-anti-sigma factor